jgi:hypothetical protein
LSPGLPSSGVNRGLVAGSGGSGANIGAEGWSSALAEAPSALMGGLAAINGTSVADPTITSVSSVSSGTIVVTTSGTSANPTKMVDALVQNPPRFHAPPQVRKSFRGSPALFVWPSISLIRLCLFHTAGCCAVVY